MVRGSATPVVKKILIPGLIFFSTTSGETTEDSQFDPGCFMAAMFSEFNGIRLPRPAGNNAGKSAS
jgi:hypothetical protein